MLMLRKWIGKLRPDNGVKTPVILQLSATECGVAALATIFAYHGVHVALEDLRDRCGTSRDGARAVTLMRVAESFGFEASAYRVELDDIKMLSQPVIAFWKFNHYVVINGVSSECVFINDPASGSVSVSFDEFDQAFTGIIIDISRTTRTVKQKRASVVLPFVREWVGRYQSSLWFILVCMMLVTMGPLMNARLSALFIDYCVIGRNINWIPVMAMLVLLSGFIFTLAMKYQKQSEFRLIAKASIVKSAEVMLHMLKLPLLFYSLRQKPELSTLLMRSELVASAMFKSLTSIMTAALSVCLCFVILFNLDAILLANLLALFLAFLVPLWVLTRVNYLQEQSCVNSLSKFYGLTLSSIKNIETIKTCGSELTIFNKWFDSFSNKLRSQEMSNHTHIKMDILYQSFHSFSMLLTLCVGSVRVGEGALTMGGLMAFYALQLYFCQQLVSLLYSFKDIQSAVVSHARIRDVMQYQTDHRFHEAGRIKLPRNSHVAITCQEIVFHYNSSGEPSLYPVNLSIQQGQHVALVGGTGSGKSTLARMIANLYHASSGQLLLYGRDVREYSAEELVKQYAYVAQDVSLFSGTIYDNLVLWQKAIPLSVVEAAIRDACLTDLIEQRGLYGKVEEGGGNFSGGERQRIDIARALIQQSSILILDEATSSLDVHTEAAIIRHLRQRPLTIVFVAHRLSTIRHCEQIFVMHQGRLMESGRHDELVRARSYYHHLLQHEGDLHADV